MAGTSGTSKQPPHGTEARYMRGDRCAACKRARADAVRGRRERKKLEEQVPVTPIGDAPSADGPVVGVEAAVRRLVDLVADDPMTQVRAQMALELARRLDKGEGAPAPVSMQLNSLLATLKPVKAAGVVPDGVAAPRLSALLGSRGRLGAGAVPGSERAAAVGD